MAAMLLAMIDNAVSKNFNSADMQIPFEQTVDKIDPWPRYLLKEIKSLLDIDGFFGTVAHLVKMKADRVIEKI